MVQLFSVTIYKWRQEKPIVLTSAFELGSFNIFTRGSAKEVLQFVGSQVVSHSKPGDRHAVLHKEHMCHVIVKHDHLAAAVCTDEEYPQRVAQSLMLKCIDGFANVHGEKWKQVESNTDLPTPQLAALLAKYQNPEEAGPFAFFPFCCLYYCCLRSF